jgi:hypothetical protein
VVEAVVLACPVVLAVVDERTSASGAGARASFRVEEALSSSIALVVEPVLDAAEPFRAGELVEDEADELFILSVLDPVRFDERELFCPELVEAVEEPAAPLNGVVDPVPVVEPVEEEALLELVGVELLASFGKVLLESGAPPTRKLLIEFSID